MRTFNAALFDLDGTLVETEELLYEVWRELVEARGHDFSSFDYARIIGRPDVECTAAVFAHYGIEEDHATFYRQFQKRAYERLPELKPRPGAKDLVERMLAAGMPCAIVTSATTHHALVALDHVGLRSAFSAIVTAETPGLARRKPHPDPYLMAARLIGAPPEHCVVFGDSPADVAAAHAAGMTIVAMPHRHSPAHTMLDADLILPDPSHFRLWMLA